MRYARLAALAMVGMLLAGCSTPFGERMQAAFSIITSASAAQVDSKIIIASAQSFDALQVAGKRYLLLPSCRNAPTVVCRDPRATRPLINAMRSGRKARVAAVKFVADHPCPVGQISCPLGASGIYDALQVSISTLQSIFANYSIGG